MISLENWMTQLLSEKEAKTIKGSPSEWVRGHEACFLCYNRWNIGQTTKLKCMSKCAHQTWSLPSQLVLIVQIYTLEFTVRQV